MEERMIGAHYDLIVIGGGPAGMSCALAAHRLGVASILLLERRPFLGGILRQCIHDGFGLLSLGESLTGPEFSNRLERCLPPTGVAIETGAYVSQVDYDRTPYAVEFLSGDGVLRRCTGRSVVIATGCRERPFGSLRIPGTRPAGIYSAGTAQYMMNLQNLLPGRSAVILGLGDIGMIMARRLTLEGVPVRMILGARRTGLAQNFRRCILDFHLPYRENHTILSVHGRKRLKGVTIAPLDGDMAPIPAERAYIPCDTLLVAAGLIPETELCPPEEREGVFLCGNVSRIFSLVDHVVQEGELIGARAALFLLGEDQTRQRALRRAEEAVRTRQEEPEEDDDTLLCCGCPRGCRLTLSPGTDDAAAVTGNACPAGLRYAGSQALRSQQSLTSTIRTDGGPFPLLPVRSDRPIPQERLLPAMAELRGRVVSASAADGAVVAENIAGTGANLTVTSFNPPRNQKPG